MIRQQEPPHLRSVSGAKDIIAVAFQRAMSNGPISRRLGWFAVGLLPLTIPMQIPAVLVGGDQVLRTNGASLMRGRAAQIRPLTLLASLLGPLLLFVVLLTIDLATGLPSGWLLGGALVLSVVELAGSWPARGVRLVWRWARQHAHPHQESEPDTASREQAVPIAFVVAFPRGGGRGSALIYGLEVMLDDAGETAELTARTGGLIEFYERHGFRSMGGDPRQMLRYPRSITGAVEEETSGRRVGTDHRSDL